MKKRILISIVFIFLLLTGCNQREYKEPINENTSNIKEEVGQSTENIEEIITTIPQEEYEIVGFWISRDELSTVKIYKDEEKNKMFFNLNSIRVKKFSRCILSEDLVEFPGDGIDFIEYVISNDTLKFDYKQERFSFIRASESDFNETNEKISKYLDEQQIYPGSSPSTLEDFIYGYWIAPNEKVAMILNQNGIADVTTINNSVGVEFTLDKESIILQMLGTYEIELSTDQKTMFFIQDDKICLTFTKYTSLDSFFEAKNKFFNNITNPLDEIQNNQEENSNNEFKTEIQDNPKANKKIENIED